METKFEILKIMETWNIGNYEKKTCNFFKKFGNFERKFEIFFNFWILEKIWMFVKILKLGKFFWNFEKVWKFGEWFENLEKL